MSRSRNITDNDVASIVDLLDGWTGRLTWKGLLEAIEKRIHARFTRQALHNYPRIKDAYAQRKAVLANKPLGLGKKTAGPPELVLALERIDRLTAQNQRLEMENDRLLEQFVRWTYNASLRNLTVDYLNQPLPPVDRDKTPLAAKPSTNSSL